MSKLALAAASVSLCIGASQPAVAAFGSDSWDCGKTLEIGHSKGLLLTIGGLPFANPHIDLPDKGSRSFNLKWDSRSKKMSVNGKACLFLTDELYWKSHCSKGDSSACDMAEKIKKKKEKP